MLATILHVCGYLLFLETIEERIISCNVEGYALVNANVAFGSTWESRLRNSSIKLTVEYQLPNGAFNCQNF